MATQQDYIVVDNLIVNITDTNDACSETHMQGIELLSENN